MKLNPSRTRFSASFANFAKELLQSAYKNILKPEEMEFLFSFIDSKCIKRNANVNKEEYFLIKKDDKDIGLFQIKPIEDSLDITRIYLKKTYQRHGIGYEAFLQIRQEAIKNNYKKIIIYINTEFKNAQKAVLKRGFKEIKETARYIGNDIYLYENYYEYELIK